MAIIRTRNIKKKNVPTMNKLKLVIEKLHRSLPLGIKNFSNADLAAQVPKDVKEGHFAVMAVYGGEPKRLVLPLSCLNHPTFVRLLEEAAEEYRFNHEGALAIPCSPAELERIVTELDNRQSCHDNGGRRRRRQPWGDSSDNNGLNWVGFIKV